VGTSGVRDRDTQGNRLEGAGMNGMEFSISTFRSFE
jgi:hypothetical protein